MTAALIAEAVVLIAVLAGAYLVFVSDVPTVRQRETVITRWSMRASRRIRSVSSYRPSRGFLDAYNASPAGRPLLRATDREGFGNPLLPFATSSLGVGAFLCSGVAAATTSAAAAAAPLVGALVVLAVACGLTDALGRQVLVPATRFGLVGAAASLVLLVGSASAASVDALFGPPTSDAPSEVRLIGHAAQADEPARHESATEPSFQRLCGPYPSGEAPADIVESLRSLWFGPGGAGALLAGCPGTPRNEVQLPEIWWSTGRCGGSMRSVGIARGDSSVLLFDRPARFAYARLLDGTLVRAFARRRTGAGDYYRIDTRQGPWLFIRRTLVSADKATRAVNSCGVPRPVGLRAATYTAVPPGALGAWLSVVDRHGWVWPVLDGSSASRNTSRYDFLSDAGVEVASTVCQSRHGCRVGPSGSPLVTTGPTPAKIIDELVSHAPAPR